MIDGDGQAVLDVTAMRNHHVGTWASPAIVCRRCAARSAATLLARVAVGIRRARRWNATFVMGEILSASMVDSRTGRPAIIAPWAVSSRTVQ